LVTGGAGGLGIAVAHALLGAGHAVALLDRSAEGLADARERLGSPVEMIVADVTSRADVESALDALAERWGRPTILVNGAGIAQSSPLLPPDDALWNRTMAVNVTGPWIVSTACLPAMREAGEGRIVNVVSTAGLQGFAYTAAYVTSKHALLGLTRAMSEDLAGKGITVNAVCPGFLDTPMTDRTVEHIVTVTGMTAEKARASLARMNAGGRLILPEQVADRILELIQDGSRNGVALRIE
jgi:NAD(P)-dependent dehydrogenase (short-subunit alcohol dehydrogenase family)